MKLTDFAKEVAKKEGLKKQVNIGQIKEIIRAIDDLLCGELYSAIRGMK